MARSTSVTILSFRVSEALLTSDATLSDTASQDASVGALGGGRFTLVCELLQLSLQFNTAPEHLPTLRPVISQENESAVLPFWPQDVGPSLFRG